MHTELFVCVGASRRAYGVVCLCGSPFREGGGPEPLLYVLLQSYAPLKISVNFLFPANSSYSLHLIKLKLDL